MRMGIEALALPSYLGFMYLKRLHGLVGLSKRSLPLLEADDELVDRDEGVLQGVNFLIWSTEEAEPSVSSEQTLGRRGLLRSEGGESESESKLSVEERPSAPYDLRFFSDSVKSRVGELGGGDACLVEE